MEHFWCTDETQAKTNSKNSPRLKLGGSHHLPPYIIFCAWPWGLHPMSFCLGTPKLGVLEFLKLGLPQLWKPIMSCEDLRLRWGLKKSYNPCWKFFNNMWNATFAQVNQSDSWLLIVWSQIDTLTLNLSFGHNLCFKSPNGSCELILDIYVSIIFQWYKEVVNLMSFDPWKCFLKIQKSIRSSIPKVGDHLGMWGSFLHTLLHFQKHEMWLPSFTLGPHLCKPLPWLQAQG